MKRSIQELSPVEFQAGRLMLWLTVDALAEEIGLGVDSIRRLEKGVKVRASTREKVARYLWGAGVLFTDHPGVVYCRSTSVQAGWPYYAPTQKAVGRFHGDRLRKACWHLRLGIFELASATGVPVVTLKAMMAAKDLQAAPTLSFYRVVLELQNRGYWFGLRASRARGDRPERPRPPARNPNHQFKWHPAPQPLSDLRLGKKGKAELKKELITLADQWECSVEEVMERLGLVGPR